MKKEKTLETCRQVAGDLRLLAGAEGDEAVKNTLSTAAGIIDILAGDMMWETLMLYRHLEDQLHEIYGGNESLLIDIVKEMERQMDKSDESRSATAKVPAREEAEK